MTVSGRLAREAAPKSSWIAQPQQREAAGSAAEIAKAVFENNPELVYKAFVKALSHGNAYCYSVLADRAFGKLKEHTELTGADGGPLDFRHLSDEDLDRQIADGRDNRGQRSLTRGGDD